VAKARATEAKSIKIGRDLRVATAAATFAALHKAAGASDSRFALDARQVEKVDAAGLQALQAGRAALVGAGKTVTWTGCSPQLTAAAALLGLVEALELPK
jgi:anti-anti-sigma regulatory factor